MRVRFTAFMLDTHSRQLTKGGEELHLSPKAFDLLAILLERRPAVADKGTLRERLWPGIHVVDASLSNLVSEIRGVLGDGDSERPLVRTIHGKGYAFSGAATSVDGEPAAPATRSAPFWVVWKQRPIVLAVGENLIGRDAACGVWIEATGVSRRHACIRVPAQEGQGGAAIEDLNSTNGTFLEGRRVDGAKRLQNGDKIKIGGATLIFREAKATDAPTKRVRPPKPSS